MTENRPVFSLWFEDAELNMKTIVCGECGSEGFEIVDARGLPWSIAVKCNKCSNEERFTSGNPSTWIKYSEV